jgi:outer membrane protein assembly factor BamB
MTRARLVAVFGLWLMLQAPSLAAPGFMTLSQVSVVQYGGYVNDVFTATYKDRQINFEVDLEKGCGLYDGHEGILALPIKGISEEQLEKSIKTRLGAPLCHLFLGPGFNLLANGKPLDKKKLRFSKGLNHAGEESGSSSFVCTLRRNDGVNLELCLYGMGQEPVLSTAFAKVLAENPTDFECKLTAVKRELALEITLFGKYQTSLPFGLDRPPKKPADGLMTARFGVSPQRDLQRPTSTGKTPWKTAVGSIEPQLQFDIARTGYWRNGDSLPKAPNVLWKYPSDDDPDQFAPGTPVADKGIVYFGDDRGRFHAVKAADGKGKWTRTYKRKPTLAAPAIADGAAFLATADEVKCVSLETGAVRWSRELPSSFGRSPPLVVGDAVFVAGGDGIYAFKRSDGKPIWNHNVLADRPLVTASFATQYAAESAGATRTSGSASDGSLLFEALYDQCRVVAIDCQSGKQRWSYSSRGWLSANPAMSGNSVLFGGFDLYLHCVDHQTGKVLWKSPTAAEVDAAPAVANGCVYFTARNSRVHCVDLETGKRIWMYRMDPAVEGMGSDCAPLISDKAVILGSTSGVLFSLDSLTGEFKWGLSLANQCQISSVGLATDGKRIFAATRGARIPQNVSGVYAVGDP